jgi:murein tripeptide amidase MpaA
MYPDTKFDYIHCMHNNIHLIILLAICIVSPVAAEPIPVRQADQIDLLNFDPPQIFQRQMVIRVRTTSQAQLDAMLELVESVWTENTGVGVLDVQIKRSNLNAITKLGIPFDILIDDLQAHTNRGWSQIIEAERLNQDSGPRGGLLHDDLWFANYKQLNEITSYIDNIAALRPELASTAIIGQSWEGRDMFAITISGPDTPENRQADRPVVFIFSTVHAREWIAPMTTVYYASKLVEDYGTDPRVQALLDSVRIVIVPMGNPDGYLFTWSDYRYWRKNRRNNSIRNNSFGVDINRNWGYEWGGQGSSGSSSSDTYRGTAPFSEPETAALRDLALSFGDQLIANMEYHSYSQLVMWPFGYASGNITPEPDRTYFDLLSNELSDEIRSVHNKNYTAMQSVNLYPAAGNAEDWFYGELDITSMIIELRPRNADFNPPPGNILPNAQENYQAIKHYIERVTEPIRIWHNSTPTAEADTSIELIITALDGIEIFDTNSPTLYTRINPTDPFEPIAMSPIGGNQYAANSPPIPCGEVLEYYFQVLSIDETLLTYPPNGSAAPFGTLAEQLVVALTDDFETDSRWIVGSDTDTATSGIWTRMNPQEVLTQTGAIVQPENDRTPYGTVCWVTDGIAGADENDRDVDNGTTTLTSPIFDANEGNEPYISFWLWFYRSDANYDHLRVDFSNDDGNTWSIVRYFNFTGQQWIQREFRIADILQPTDQMRIRFVAYDNENDGIVEAAIDDLKVEYLGCPSLNPADINGDGTLNFFDISAFITALSAQDPIADFNNDGRWNFFDISAFLTAYADG